MSFLDKAKAKAAELAGTVKDKVDDFKDSRKVEDLLEDLGRITYRQRIGGTDPGDAAAIEALIAALKQLETEGAVIAKSVEPDDSEPDDSEPDDSEPERAATTLAAPTGAGTPMPPPPPPR